jgi:hypothetical protein
LNKYIVIETKYGESSVKSYPSALKGDAKIGSRLWNGMDIQSLRVPTGIPRWWWKWIVMECLVSLIEGTRREKSLRKKTFYFFIGLFFLNTVFVIVLGG